MSAKLYREFRSEGMRRPSIRVRLGGWAQILRELPALRRPGREQWWRRAAFRGGRLVGSARFRVVCL